MFVEIDVQPWQPAPAVSERPLFAIGDVHGRHDLLIALLDAIQKQIERDGLRGSLAVLLGDYIDRGPKNLAALSAAFDYATGDKFELIPLPGNHEQLLLCFLNDRTRFSASLCLWLENGGDAVVSELGWRVHKALSDPEGFRIEVRKAIGMDTIDRLSALSNHFRSGRYLFVHAGIHPLIGLKMLQPDWRQTQRSVVSEDIDPLWIRGPFLTHRGSFEDGVIVVHGHTPQDEPELLSNRINLDTRAYETGRLTAIQILSGHMRVIQAVGDRRERARGWL